MTHFGRRALVGARLLVPPPFLVLDIETILDPELPIVATGDVERLPAPPHHQVVVIGSLLFGAGYDVQDLGVSDSADEATIVSDFARLLEERQPCLVTFNGRTFDLPVIAARCLRHGVPLRRYYRARDVRYRFSPERHFDLMDHVADFGAAKPARLDVVAKLCGMPGKVGVEGKDVGPLVHAGRLEDVRHYCLCDVAQSAAIFLRVQLVRGELDREAYLDVMRRLLELVHDLPKVFADLYALAVHRDLETESIAREEATETEDFVIV